MTHERVDILDRTYAGQRARRVLAYARGTMEAGEATRSLRRTGRQLMAFALLAIFAGNLAVIVWLWLHNGGVSVVHSWGDAATSAGRITGLLATYALFVQVILLIRLPPLERLVGLDHLSVWHRTNGKVTLYLILAHVGLITAGYAAMDRVSFVTEFTTLVTQYAAMWRALFGTVMLVLVALTSLVIVKRRLRYEAWLGVHLLAYGGVILSWPHTTADGNEFLLDSHSALYWTALYFGTLGLVVLCRLAWPLLQSLRFNLRVREVIQESPNVYSVIMSGRRLDKLSAKAGQFFLWRFLSWGRFWEAHPFSLSAAPDGESLRITVKQSGDFTAHIGDLKPGTRVIIEGPFGVFTDAARRSGKMLLVAGGIGISPIRALLEETTVDTVLLYRAVKESDLVFREELDSLAFRRGTRVHYLTGDFRVSPSDRYLSPDHLAELVPDLSERDAFVCGPPPMMAMVEKNLRRAGVPRRYIHSEKFAL